MVVAGGDFFFPVSRVVHEEEGRGEEKAKEDGRTTLLTHDLVLK